MKLRVTGSDDLVDLYGRYIEMVESDREEPLELAFEPGVYGVASIGPIHLDLGGNPPPKAPKIDVVLRGSPDGPVTIRDMGLLVNARSLHLENLVLRGRQQAVLQCRVARAFTMRNCVVADNSWGGIWDGVLVQVHGTVEQEPYTVEITDSWFVRNSEQTESTVLAIRPAVGSYVERVDLTRVGFLDNRNRYDLLVDEAREIQLTDVLAVKDRPDGVVLRYGRSERVRIDRSTFVVNEPGRIASEDTRTWASGIELRNSTVFATDTRHGPVGTLRNVQVRDRALLRASRAAYDACLTSIAERVPDAATARAQLADALGLQC